MAVEGEPHRPTPLGVFGNSRETCSRGRLRLPDAHLPQEPPSDGMPIHGLDHGATLGDVATGAPTASRLLLDAGLEPSRIRIERFGSRPPPAALQSARAADRARIEDRPTHGDERVRGATGGKLQPQCAQELIVAEPQSAVAAIDRIAATPTGSRY